MRKKTTRKFRKKSVQELAEMAQQGIEERGLLSQMEMETEEQKRHYGQRSMDEKLARLPPENGRPKPCPRCGRNARVRTKDVARTFHSLSGTHTIVRNYHWCEKCQEGFYPQDELLGLPKVGAVSEELEARIVDFAVNDAYELAEARWKMHYAHKVSANQFRQVAKRLGKCIEETDDLLLQSSLLEPSTGDADTLYAMTDGSMVPMRQGWNEVKVGVVFRAEDHVSHREVRRGTLVRARYVAVLGGQEPFKKQLSAALRATQSGPVRRKVWLGDGAPGNWTLASSLCPDAIQVLDVQHAIEHAMDLGKALLGETDPALELWQCSVEHLVYTGKINILIQQALACIDDAPNPGALAAINDFVRYCRKNRRRMRYPEYLERGLLIGSGIVESAHRHVIQIRMKRAGQHWGWRGGRRMARLRAAYRTAGPERFHRCLRWAYRQSTYLRAVVDLAAHRPKRRASNR